MSDEKALALRSTGGGDVDVARLSPLFTPDQAVQRKTVLDSIIRKVLKEGDDYGKMPGDSRDDAKKVLMKPGAEKLATTFGLTPQYEEMLVIEDWTGEKYGGEPLFYYKIRCRLWRGDMQVGEAFASANSREAKYRYRWVKETDVPEYLDASRLMKRSSSYTEFDFAIERKETEGKYGKPAAYWERFEQARRDKTAIEGSKTSSSGKELKTWTISGTMVRIPNPDVFDTVNTLQKMAQKRALVAAVLVATNASDSFTQDLEDVETEPQMDLGGHPVGTQEAANHVRDEKLKQALKIPDELDGFVKYARNAKTVDETTAALKAGYQWIRDQMILLRQKEGDETFIALGKDYKKDYPDNWNKTEETVKFWVRLHQKITQWRAQDERAKQAPPATDSDAPPDLGPLADDEAAMPVEDQHGE